MPWEPYDKLSKEQKEEHARETARINKAWGEKNERERRERVANALGIWKRQIKSKQWSFNQAKVKLIVINNQKCKN